MDSKPTARSTVPRKETSKTANLEIGAPRKPSPIWHSRGYIPHFEGPDRIQHVTFRLADSIPKPVLRQLDNDLKTLPANKHDIERRKRIEGWIDAGHGSCILRNPPVAKIVQNSFLAFDAIRYRLLAWVVMPNHVHVLFEPINEWRVAQIVASWKKFTARRICGLPGSANLQIGVFSSGGSTASVWHREYWDRYIRDERHLNQTIEYIHLNPVKAGLVATPENWPWSSANRDRPGA